MTRDEAEELIERIGDETCVEVPGKAHDRVMVIVARLIREKVDEPDSKGGD